MPPKSKLSDKQWQEIIKRKLGGEKTRPLAREYGITEGAIRQRVATQCTQIKETANQMLDVEAKFNSLPTSTQILTINYANELRAISSHMLKAGVDSSATSSKLASMARMMSVRLDYRDDMKAEEIEEQLLLLKSVAALQNTANTANIIPSSLLALNKDIAPKLINIPEGAFDAGKKIVEMSDEELLSIASGSSA